MSRLPIVLKRVAGYVTSRPARFLRQSRYWRDAGWMKGSGDIYTILSTTKRFVRSELPGILQVDPTDPLKMELPVSGSQSFTTIVSAGDRRAVLRVYPMFQQETAEAHQQNTRLLKSHGVNVPDTLFFSPQAKRKYDAILLLENFIDGEMRRGEALTDANITAMAEQLARLHSVHDPHWGRVGSERDEPFFPPLSDRIARDLELLKSTGLLSDADTDTVRVWTAEWRDDFQSLQHYSLTHNDLLPANGIFTPAGDYYFIDLNRLQWGPAAREVVRCFHRQLRGQQESIQAFSAAYYNALDPQDAETTMRFCEFYEVFHRITTLVKRSAKMQKHAAGVAHFDERQQLIRDELMQLVTSQRLA